MLLRRRTTRTAAGVVDLEFETALARGSGVDDSCATLCACNKTVACILVEKGVGFQEEGREKEGSRRGEVAARLFSIFFFGGGAGDDDERS